MSFDFVKSFCCIFLHGFYFLFLVLVYLFFFRFSYLKSIRPFFCAINNNFSHQCPIKYYLFFFFLIILCIRSSQPEVFRKRILWDPDMFFGETLRMVLVIFFLFLFHYYYYSFFKNLAKISDNLFLIICNLEDAYFVKKLLMVASKIITHSEIYSPSSLKCKISAIWLVETACIFLIFLIATVQISMECESQES